MELGDHQAPLYRFLGAVRLALVMAGWFPENGMIPQAKGSTQEFGGALIGHAQQHMGLGLSRHLRDAKHAKVSISHE